ncbi:MAG: UDP-2,3-diacylglucosamine diphosphatase LpxI [Alphaproteobacteria bacterium]
MSGQSDIAIIAGSGAFPFEIAYSLKENGQTPFLLCLRGFVGRDDSLHEFDHAYADMLDPQKILALLREKDIKRVILAGGVSRPGPMALLSIYSFFRNRDELKRIVSGGDDRILRGVIRLLEENNFAVIGVNEAAPKLLTNEGLLGSIKDTPSSNADIDMALSCLRMMSPYDIGQGVVVAQGRVLAVEGPEGTDEMLDRVRIMQKNRRVILEDGTAILVKASKQGQDHRVDLPAIGPRTIKNAKAAGLAGIAIAAGEVIIVNRNDTIKDADRAGLFVKGVRLS